MNDRWKKRCTPRRGTLRRVTFSIEFGCGETELRNVRCRFDGGPYPARCRPSPRHRAAAVVAAGPHPGGGVTCGRGRHLRGPGGHHGHREGTGRQSGPGGSGPRRTPARRKGPTARRRRSAIHTPRAARRWPLAAGRWPRGPFIFSGAARPACGPGGPVAAHGVQGPAAWWQRTVCRAGGLVAAHLRGGAAAWWQRTVCGGAAWTAPRSPPPPPGGSGHAPSQGWCAPGDPAAHRPWEGGRDAQLVGTRRSLAAPGGGTAVSGLAVRMDRCRRRSPADGSRPRSRTSVVRSRW